MAVVTGIGGVFFKAKDPESLAAWYRNNLGIPFDAKMGLAVLRWEDDKRVDAGATAWCLAKDDTEWFSPSPSSFMINYRVTDMDALVARLQALGIAIHKGPETHDNGLFLWVLDPEGNKVELWEPKGNA